MVLCSVKGCKNRSAKTKGTSIKYYSFPKTEHYINCWLNVCKRRVDKKHSRICSIHFDKDCYEIPLKYRLMQYTPRSYRDLKSDAVPTLHLSNDILPTSTADRKVNINKDNNSQLPKDTNKTNTETTCDIKENKESKPSTLLTSDVNNIETVIGINQTSSLSKPSSSNLTKLPISSQISNVAKITKVIDSVSGKSTIVIFPREDVQINKDVNSRLPTDSDKINIESTCDHKEKKESNSVFSTSDNIETSIDIKQASSLPKPSNNFTKLPHTSQISNVAKMVTKAGSDSGKSTLVIFPGENVQACNDVVKRNNLEIQKLQKELTKAKYENELIRKQLQKIFTPGQYKKLLNPHTKIYWTPDDIKSAISLRRVSPKAYEYLRQKDFPLPSPSTLKAWKGLI